MRRISNTSSVQNILTTACNLPRTSRISTGISLNAKCLTSDRKGWIIDELSDGVGVPVLVDEVLLGDVVYEVLHLCRRYSLGMRYPVGTTTTHPLLVAGQRVVVVIPIHIHLAKVGPVTEKMKYMKNKFALLWGEAQKKIAYYYLKVT